MRILISGDCGVEEHYLVERALAPENVPWSKAALGTLLATDRTLGGSATISAIAASRLNTRVILDGTVATDAAGREVAERLGNLCGVRPRTGRARTARFVSIWHAGKGVRELYVPSSPQAAREDERPALEGVSHWLRFGCRDLQWCGRQQVPPCCFVTAVPNGRMNIDIKVLRTLGEKVDLSVLSLAELSRLAQVAEELWTTIREASRLGRGSFAVTAGRQGARLVHNGEMSDWIMPARELEFPLGAGDVLATALTLLWNIVDPISSLADAQAHAGELVADMQPFGGNASLLHLPTHDAE